MHPKKNMEPSTREDIEPTRPDAGSSPGNVTLDKKRNLIRVVSQTATQLGAEFSGPALDGSYALEVGDFSSSFLLHIPPQQFQKLIEGMSYLARQEPEELFE